MQHLSTGNISQQSAVAIHVSCAYTIIMKHRTLPKQRKGAWFIPLRGSYLPATWQGWLLYIPYLSYAIISLVYVIDRAGSPLEIIINIVPYWLAALVAMTWIAKQKS